MRFWITLTGLLLLAGWLWVAPASASSLFLDGMGSASLGTGDVLDQVILTDDAHVEVNAGAVLGEITLLDFSTADLFDGLILGDLEVYDDSTLNIHGTDFTVDGAAAPSTVDATFCPTCALLGTLSGGEVLDLTAKVTFGGQIHVNPVPEPATAVLFGLGLFGLAAFALRLAQ